MANWNWNQYSYRNLDEQRQDKAREQTRGTNQLMGRLGIAVFAILVVVIKNIPDYFKETFDESIMLEVLPIIGVFMAVILPIIAFSVGVFLYRRRKRGQNEFDEYAGPQSSAERYTLYTGSDYSNIVDSWDIKDPKPPWEL